MVLILSQSDKENREKLLLERKNYYQNTFIQLELVKNLKNKEMCWLEGKNGSKNVRFLYASKIDFLKMHFDKLDFFNHFCNIYCSCANLSFIPTITYNLKMRRQSKEYQEINNNYAKYVTSYDFFLDYDFKEDFESGLKEAKEMKKILEEMQVPFYILNSSNKGIHIIIPAIYFDGDPIKNVDIFREVIYNIKGIYSFKFLDDSISDLKRVRKLPYSLITNVEKGKTYVAIPLNDDQFNKFSPERVELDYVMKNISIKNRGLFLRHYGLSESQLKINTAKFLKEFL